MEQTLVRGSHSGSSSDSLGQVMEQTLVGSSHSDSSSDSLLVSAPLLASGCPKRNRCANPLPGCPKSKSYQAVGNRSHRETTLGINSSASRHPVTLFMGVKVKLLNLHIKSLMKMQILERFKWHLEAFASELYIYILGIRHVHLHN